MTTIRHTKNPPASQASYSVKHLTARVTDQMRLLRHHRHGRRRPGHHKTFITVVVGQILRIQPELVTANTPSTNLHHNVSTQLACLNAIRDLSCYLDRPLAPRRPRGHFTDRQSIGAQPCPPSGGHHGSDFTGHRAFVSRGWCCYGFYSQNMLPRVAILLCLVNWDFL